jgi:peptide/nickel transport system substrate-binding protein
MNRSFFKWVVRITLIASVAVSIPACSAVTKDATASQIVIVIAEDPPSFNATLTDTGYDALVMELVMLGLADIDPNGKIFPELAAELPTLENGAVVVDDENGTMDVTWKLRSDVVWEDGTPVSADDVIFTYEAIVDPEKGGWIQGIDYIDSLEKVDAHTVIVHYNAIYPGYLTQFGGEQMAIWPAHYCNAEQGFSQWDCASKPLSNGPYKLEEWVVGDHMTFIRNPKYYEEGKPSIERIVVRIVPDQSVRKEMLITTRFGNSNQYHYVKFPGGDRKQLTFFEEPVGEASFEPKQLEENLAAAIEAVVKAKPSGSKGQYIKSATVTTSMGPGIPLDLRAIGAAA